MANFVRRVVRLVALSILLAASSAEADAQSAALSARDSDPRVMGWMQGFPPAPNRSITQPDSNFFSFPKLRWSVCHLCEFLPTETISRGIGAPVPLRFLPPVEFAEMRQEIDALGFVPLGGEQEMTWDEAFYANYTDGILILQRGQVVYERCSGCLTEDRKHAAMSMTK